MAPLLATGRAAWRWAAAAFAALGLFVQVLGVTVDSGAYLSVLLTQVAPVSESDTGLAMRQSTLYAHFIPEFSPLAGHWWLLMATVEQARSPGKSDAENVTLHQYPWSRSGALTRPPDHPDSIFGGSAVFLT
jgi:hypothetical protein